MNRVLPAEVDLDRLRFDPSQGQVIREPDGHGYGYWAGGHKVFFDDQTNRFVLFYRLRSPLEAGGRVRGVLEKWRRNLRVSTY